MVIRRRRGWEIPESQATPEALVLNRRAIMAAAGAGTMLAPTVAKAAPSMSSSSITKPNCDSSAVINETTAIESSSGTAPSNGVSLWKVAVRPCRPKTLSSTCSTSCKRFNGSSLRALPRDPADSGQAEGVRHAFCQFFRHPVFLKPTLRTRNALANSLRTIGGLACPTPAFLH